MSDTKKLYLELLKKCLTDLIYSDNRTNPNIFFSQPYDEEKRINGRDFPAVGHTMIGIKRLDNLQFCIEDVLKNNVAGDFIETGVWRGGAAIFMKAVLKVRGIDNRHIWLADSFAGLPAPNAEKYPADKDSFFHKLDFLAVPLATVKENFAKYDLLDENVKFLEGFFKDTLPSAPVEKLAIIRLDGDMYESTMDALTNLYPKLSPGGYLIVDDYAIKACRQAVEDFRRVNKIKSKIKKIDWSGIFWQNV